MNKKEIEKAIEMMKERYEFAKENYLEEVPEYVESLRMSIEAIEKQIPKKPIEEEKQYSEDYGFNSDILCPTCKAYIGYYTEAMSKPEYMKYCNECGQKIDDDWSGEDE